MTKDRKDYQRKYQKFSISGQLSPYGRFHLLHLGFSFRNKLSGQVIRKSTYWDKFKNSYQPEWELIPYEPESGWSKAEKTDHFNGVDEVIRAYQNDILAPLISEVINF
jgi:hypothetical protein